MDSKDTNPKDSVGIRKVPLHVVPAEVLMELGLAMLEGARKYGSHNYRVAGVRASVYYDAAMRHLMAFWEGENTDPDSGLPHVVKAMACLTVLRDSQQTGNWVDDRPPCLPDGLNLPHLNQQAVEIIDRYPVAHKPYTEAGPPVADPHITCGDCADLDCRRLTGGRFEPDNCATGFGCFRPKDGA
jgi:hypothetical protein